MFNRRTSKWLTAITIFITLSSPLSLSTAQAVSKVPVLNPNSVIMESVDPITMPDDYPQDLTDWYDSNVDARSFAVIDVETNKILAQREGNMPYPIASMTKILSVYLIYKAIDEGKLDLDQKITIPDPIVEHISSNPELSNIWLISDFEYTVEDLIYAIMLASANDATSALMWEIYGDEQSSVLAMQNQLTEWGITNAQLYSTSGAPNEEVPESFWMPGSNSMNENTMAAADVALMAQHIVEEYPEILEVTSTREFIYMEGTDEQQSLYNPNQLLEGGNYGREGVTGLKSGFTDAAGLNFVATGSQNDRDYVAVAMGTFGEGMSSYWEIEILLDGLVDYPDMYELTLPTNLKVAESTELILDDEELDDDQAIEITDSSEDIEILENNRDNPMTNFMRDLFGIFN